MSDETMNNIIERIKSRRNELEYSFQDLADLTGMSKSTLQRYETGGIKNVPLNKLKILAEALKVTPEWLMGWDDIVWYESSTGILNAEDELKALLSRLNSASTVMYGNTEMSDISKTMLKNSLENAVQNIELLLKK